LPQSDALSMGFSFFFMKHGVLLLSPSNKPLPKGNTVGLR